MTKDATIDTAGHDHQLHEPPTSAVGYIGWRVVQGRTAGVNTEENQTVKSPGTPLDAMGSFWPVNRPDKRLGLISNSAHAARLEWDIVWRPEL